MLLKLKNEGDTPPERILAKDGEWFVPVIRGIGFKSEKEAEAYLVSDNQTTILGGWDDTALQAIPKDHAEDLSGIGFTPQDVEAFRMPLPDNYEREKLTMEEFHVNWAHPPNVEKWLASKIIGRTLNVCCGMSRIGDVRLDTDPGHAGQNLGTCSTSPTSLEASIAWPAIHPSAILTGSSGCSGWETSPRRDC